jgi:hypothetical protein
MNSLFDVQRWTFDLPAMPFFEGKVSGVSVQDMLLRLPFLKPDT